MGRAWQRWSAHRRKRAKTKTANNLVVRSAGSIPGWSATENGSASEKRSCSLRRRSNQHSVKPVSAIAFVRFSYHIQFFTEFLGHVFCPAVAVDLLQCFP